MRKIKVCHICNLGMNGKAVFLCNLLENIDYDRYEVTIINCRAEHAEPVFSRLEKIPVHIVTPPKRNAISFCLFLNDYFEKNKFDVCHSHMWDLSGLFLAVAHHRGIPVRAAHSHNTSKEAGRYNKIKGFLRDKIIWNALLQMIKLHGNRYIACSEEAAKWLFVPSIVDKKKYTIAPNGIELNKFLNHSRTQHQPIEILFAGRFIYQKNPLFAINCFAEYLKINPDAHMTMIGNGKLDSDVRDEINKLNLKDHIAIVPETSDMPKYYRGADLFLFPSHYEGLGIVLVEAQASGLKCLASDTVPRDTQCGLVNYQSLKDGAAAWGGYINDLINDNHLAINDALLKRYDIRNTVGIIDRVYGL